jgi:hypothetical protein
MIFVEDRETFAAERSEALTEAAGLLMPSIRADLERWGAENWFSRIVDAAIEVWTMTAEDQGSDIGVTDAFLTALRESLALTGEPESPPSDVQVRRMADWLGTYVINATTMASAQAEGGGVLLEWVTMRDDDVRDLHRPLQGVQVPVGGTFSV